MTTAIKYESRESPSAGRCYEKPRQNSILSVQLLQLLLLKEKSDIFKHFIYLCNSVFRHVDIIQHAI